VKQTEAIMKPKAAALLVAGALLAGLASSAAFAHGSYRGYYGHAHPRVGVGVYFGGPVWWGPRYYYPPSYYYYPPYGYPPVVTVPSSPPVYIERGESPPAADEGSSNWWYYCVNPQGYYPYVKQCPGGWQRVAPQPPPG
jgi:hypothetical protein